MKKTLFCILLCSISYSLFSQSTLYKSYNIDQHTEVNGNNIHRNEDGSYLVGVNGPTFVKIDKFGIVQWEQHHPISFSSSGFLSWPQALVKLDNGDFISSIRAYKSSTGDAFSFIMKMDSLGNFLWLKEVKLDGASGEHEMLGLELLPNGNIAGCGNGAKTDNDTDRQFWVYAMDTSGAFVWSRTQSFRQGVFSDMLLRGNGNIVTMGSGMGGELHIAEFMPTGAFVKHNTIITNQNIQLKSFSMTPDSALIMTGLSGVGLSFCGMLKAKSNYDVSWVKRGLLLGSGNNHGMNCQVLNNGNYAWLGEGLIYVTDSLGTLVDTVLYPRIQMRYIHANDEGGYDMWGREPGLLDEDTELNFFKTDSLLSSVCGDSTVSINSFVPVTQGNSAGWASTAYTARGPMTLDLSWSLTTGSTTTSQTIVCQNIICNAVADFSLSLDTVCPGDNALFTNASQGATIYTWKVGSAIVSTSINANYAFSNPGNNVVRLLASNGVCTDSTDKTVFVRTPATVSISGDAVICNGDTAQLMSSGASTYSWSTGDNGANIEVMPNITTTYQAYGTDAKGCRDTSGFEVVVNANPAIVINGDTAMCGGDSVLLIASGASTYDWSPVAAMTDSVWLMPAINTLYTVEGTDTNGCKNITSQTVHVVTQANTSLSGDSTICEGATAIVTASGSGTYVWNPGSLNGAVQNLSPTTTTTYTIFGNAGTSCGDTASFTVDVNALPTLSITAPADGDTVCQQGGDINLQGSPAGGSFFGTGVTDTLFDPATAGTGSHQIGFTFAESNGCTDTTYIAVHVEVCTGLENAFVNKLEIFPNPFNDRLEIRIQDAIIEEVVLRNALGQLLVQETGNGSKIQLNTSQLSKGIYFIEVKTSVGVVVRRLLK